MNSVVYWALNRAKEPSTWAGLAGLGQRKHAWLPLKLDRLMPSGWRKSQPTWILLVAMNWTAAYDSINAPAGGCEWIRPITVAEADGLTTETKRALLVHNELYEEFCRDE